MNIVAMLLGNKLVELGVDRALEEVIKHGIAVASTYRSKRFLDTLVEAVQMELDHDAPETDLNRVLTKLAAKANSEAVFDACRRACLSRSRELGPRIIALVTAVLLREERAATEEEEMILDLSERLTDSEFDVVVKTIREWERELRSGSSKKVEIRWGELRRQVDKVELSDQAHGDVELGSRLLGEFGLLGERLRSCGLVDEYIDQSRFHWAADSERYIDEDGSGTRTVWTIAFKAGYRNLADYIERAQRSVSGGEIEGVGAADGSKS